MCLILLLREAAAFDSVKNELNFAFNHRILIRVVLLNLRQW